MINNVIILLILGGFSAFNFTQPLKAEESAIPKVVREPECGVEAYQQKSDPLCGILNYNSQRQPICGVEQYNVGTSSDICGNQRVCTPPPPGCVVGPPETIESIDDFIGSQQTMGQLPRRCPTNLCELKAKSCRHPSFGVESYKECSHPDFGVATYNTCARPEFGVQTYKTCTVLMTRSEIELFLTKVKADLDKMSYLYATASSNYLTKNRNKAQFGCVIQQNENDPIHADLVTELKNTFLNVFGEAYRPDVTYCENQDKTNPPLVYEGVACDNLSIEEIIAALNDAATPVGMRAFLDLCQAKQSYEFASQWFVFYSNETSRLLNDVVARQNASIQEQLSALQIKLDASILKP